MVRPSWYAALVRRKGGPLPPRRAASRLSAFVYGNILVLAAVVAVSPESIAHGNAALLVIGTGVTTYIAHVFADLVAHANIPEAHGAVDEADARRLAVTELRDAVPIASAATLPTLILAMAWLGWLPTATAQLLAGIVVAVRISTIQVVTERVRGNRPGPRLLIAGLATAVVAALIVALKTALGH